eukprot:jgi/Ulvmu1/1380/UM011_0108.1
MGSGISKSSGSGAGAGPANEGTMPRIQPPPDTPPELVDLYQLSNTYKENSFERVLTKCALAGAAGLVIGPIANRGPFLNTALISSANAAIVMGFYDVVREAVTAATVVDTPFISFAAGALTGYVWNGLVHQSKSRAVSGGLVVGALAAAFHVALPTFDAYKMSIATLLDFELMSDPDGTLRSAADAPATLPPFSTQATRDYLGALALQFLPVKEISPEEYDKMQEKQHLKIGFRGPLEPEEMPEASPERASDSRQR